MNVVREYRKNTHAYRDRGRESKRMAKKRSRLRWFEYGQICLIFTLTHSFFRLSFIQRVEGGR